MRQCFTFVVICMSLAASQLQAQHADIRPSVVGGTIVTGSYNDSTGEILSDVRVFGYDFQEDEFDPYFISDPGFNASSSSGLTPGSQLGFNIIDGDLVDLPANLTFWDGDDEVLFDLTPNAETITLAFGSQSRTVGSSTGAQAGFSFQTVLSNGSIHRHLSSTLNGASPTVGIYLLALELTISDPNIEKSLPFFIVYNNGLSEEAHDLAIDWVQENLAVVPEASTVMMLGTAALGFGVVCYRRRKMI